MPPGQPFLELCVCESPQPHTTDVLGRLLLECLDKFPKEKFLGRSYDLKAAYRQLGLGEEALRHAYITFYDYGDGKPAIHRLNALPFGAIRSAHSFRNVSHSLGELGCSLGLLWTCYFHPRELRAELRINSRPSIRLVRMVLR